MTGVCDNTTFALTRQGRSQTARPDRFWCIGDGVMRRWYLSSGKTVVAGSCKPRPRPISTEHIYPHTEQKLPPTDPYRGSHILL